MNRINRIHMPTGLPWLCAARDTSALFRSARIRPGGAGYEVMRPVRTAASLVGVCEATRPGIDHDPVTTGSEILYIRICRCSSGHHAYLGIAVACRSVQPGGGEPPRFTRTVDLTQPEV